MNLVKSDRDLQIAQLHEQARTIILDIIYLEADTSDDIEDLIYRIDAFRREVVVTDCWEPLVNEVETLLCLKATLHKEGCVMEGMWDSLCIPPAITEKLTISAGNFWRSINPLLRADDIQDLEGY